ncbi:hypothetical protein J6590_002818 [Homalodisca vitripennis]|nr:hypothetical protein J6590_002818 [Homalodisca vitripennis]
MADNSSVLLTFLAGSQLDPPLSSPTYCASSLILSLSTVCLNTTGAYISMIHKSWQTTVCVVNILGRFSTRPPLSSPTYCASSLILSLSTVCLNTTGAYISMIHKTWQTTFLAGSQLDPPHLLPTHDTQVMADNILGWFSTRPPSSLTYCASSLILFLSTVCLNTTGAYISMIHKTWQTTFLDGSQLNPLLISYLLCQQPDTLLDSPQHHRCISVRRMRDYN